MFYTLVLIQLDIPEPLIHLQSERGVNFFQNDNLTSQIDS